MTHNSDGWDFPELWDAPAPIAPIDYWRLCDDLSVVQAALLIVGVDPAMSQDSVEHKAPKNRPKGYDAAKAAIESGLLSGSIQGELKERSEYDMEDNHVGYIEGTVNIHTSRVKVSSLKDWLEARGITSGFFFPINLPNAEYLDRGSGRYAPKLAAAVGAWLAYDPEKNQGRSPRQGLEKWLREHATEYGLTDDDGKINEKGIEECSKVANWNPKGGAPKTPV